MTVSLPTEPVFLGLLPIRMSFGFSSYLWNWWQCRLKIPCFYTDIFGTSFKTSVPVRRLKTSHYQRACLLTKILKIWSKSCIMLLRILHCKRLHFKMLIKCLIIKKHQLLVRTGPNTVLLYKTSVNKKTVLLILVYLMHDKALSLQQKLFLNI